MSEFYGLDKLSLVDFDGKITCTLFTAGCNFRCPFCHNYSLVMEKDTLQSYSFEEILQYLNKRKNLIEAVCISGGEPTLMSDLENKIVEIKKLGYIVKLDTNGTNPELIKKLYELKLVDYIAMDIKNSFENYIPTIGLEKFNLIKIKESINYIMNSGIDYEFRTTLIKEFHEENDIIEIGKMIYGAKKFFLQHFVDHDTCIVQGLHEIKKEKALEFKNLLKPYVKNTQLRGY